MTQARGVPLALWNKCRRKRRYKGCVSAQKYADELIQKGEDVHAYECPICGNWHVGHRKERDVKEENWNALSVRTLLLMVGDYIQKIDWMEEVGGEIFAHQVSKAQLIREVKHMQRYMKRNSAKCDAILN